MEWHFPKKDLIFANSQDVEEDSMTQDSHQKLIQAIADLGLASEVELRVETLQPRKELLEELQLLEKAALINRRREIQTGYGNMYELTRKGYRYQNANAALEP
jgi:hypothetical protein